MNMKAVCSMMIVPTYTFNFMLIASNACNYSKEVYCKALLVRNIYNVINRPYIKDYIRIVANHHIPNCPMTKADIVTTEYIFRFDVMAVKGKTVGESVISTTTTAYVRET